MTAPADGQRQLILAHQHDRPAEHLAQNHLLDFGRLQGVGNQHFQVVVPADDVDPLAGQFIDNVLDAIAAHADARADAIDARIAAGNGHLRAVARLAGHRPNFDHAVGDFRNFLLEQPLHELRPGAAQDHLHAAARLADFEHRRPHALVHMVRFARNLLAARQDGFDVRQRAPWPRRLRSAG